MQSIHQTIKTMSCVFDLGDIRSMMVSIIARLRSSAMGMSCMLALLVIN